MPGHRFFIEPAPGAALDLGSTIELTEADSHHARNVLRLTAGDHLTAVRKDTGAAYEAVIESLGDRVSARITESGAQLASSSRVKRVLFALCKGERNDLVCEKLTELGVGEIHLFQAERSVVRLHNEADASKKLSRFQRIAETAAKQSARNSVPKISLSTSLRDALATSIGPDERGYFCSLSAGSRDLHNIAPPPGLIHLSIGPEGDLSPAEEGLLRDRNFEPISLGPAVLRSETAAIAAVAMAYGAWGFHA